jgi:superfamily II DNA helicase RecQ
MMQIKVFTIPVHDGGAAISEMNQLLRNNKILEVRENFVGKGNGAFWCFSVRYMEMPFRPQMGAKAKVDYKEVLDAPTFSKFSKLREIRKQAAAEEGLPAFAIFTDEELAGLAGLKSIARKEMLSIKGIGEKKVERFAHYFIEEEAKDETRA